MYKFIPKSILAGMLISFGAYASMIANAYTGSRILSAMVFSVGFIMVLLSGAALFTGQCLFIVDRVKDINFYIMMLITYLGNLCGALIMVILIRWITPAEIIMELTNNIAVNKLSMPAWSMFINGILCNMLVCLAIWFYKNRSEQLHGIDVAIIGFIPIFTFVLCGFEHSIANMFYLPFSSGIFTWEYLRQIGLVTLGNITGGIFIGIFKKTT